MAKEEEVYEREKHHSAQKLSFRLKELRKKHRWWKNPMIWSTSWCMKPRAVHDGIQKIGTNPEDRADVYQEAWLRVLRNKYIETVADSLALQKCAEQAAGSARADHRKWVRSHGVVDIPQEKDLTEKSRHWQTFVPVSLDGDFGTQSQDKYSDEMEETRMDRLEASALAHSASSEPRTVDFYPNRAWNPAWAGPRKPRTVDLPRNLWRPNWEEVEHVAPNELPARQRETLALLHMGWSYREIARTLGIVESTAKDHGYKAQAKIRNFFLSEPRPSATENVYIYERPRVTAHTRIVRGIAPGPPPRVIAPTRFVRGIKQLFRYWIWDVVNEAPTVRAGKTSVCVPLGRYWTSYPRRRGCELFVDQLPAPSKVLEVRVRARFEVEDPGFYEWCLENGHYDWDAGLWDLQVLARFSNGHSAARPGKLKQIESLWVDPKVFRHYPQWLTFEGAPDKSGPGDIIPPWRLDGFFQKTPGFANNDRVIPVHRDNGRAWMWTRGHECAVPRCFHLDEYYEGFTTKSFDIPEVIAQTLDHIHETFTCIPKLACRCGRKWSAEHPMGMHNFNSHSCRYTRST